MFHHGALNLKVGQTGEQIFWNEYLYVIPINTSDINVSMH